MSFVVAAPDALVAAASDIAGIGSSVEVAGAAAAVPTTGVITSAADQVSALVASVFSAHGQGYQQLGARLAALHQDFVQNLTAGAGAFAATEASAAQTLANTVNAPAQALLGQPLTGGRSMAAPTLSQVQSLFLGGPGALARSAAIVGPAANSVLALLPTGGTAALAASAPAQSIGDAIENLYNTVEPYVAYGFSLVAYAAGWAGAGVLAPQINFLYYLFEPIVQSALFNTLDWLGGTISFSQGLANFWSATNASINQFINTEIDWVRSLLPPLPPLPPAA